MIATPIIIAAIPTMIIIKATAFCQSLFAILKRRIPAIKDANPTPIIRIDIRDTGYYHLILYIKSLVSGSMRDTLGGTK